MPGITGLPGIRTVMRWLSLGFTPKYYFDAVNGSDSNSGLSQALAWKTITKFNATVFQPGDKIGFKRGQTFSGAMILPSSGTAGNIIVVGAYGTGSKPIITQSASTKTISAVTRSYYTFQDLDVRNTSVTATYNAISLSGTAHTGVKIQRCDISSPGYGISSAAPLINAEISNITYSGGAHEGIYIYGTGSQNVTVNNCTINNTAGAGCIYVRYCENVSMSNNIVTNANGGTTGASYLVANCTGILSLNNLLSTGSAGIGLYLLNNTFTSGNVSFCRFNTSAQAGISVNNCSGFNFWFTKCNGSGVGNGMTLSTGSHHINAYGCMVSNGGADGFATVDTSHDFNFWFCRASHNGDKNSTTGGDGYTSHQTNYNINFIGCISDYNTCTGFALVGTSSGLVYNCLSYKCAGDWRSVGGLDQIRAGFYLGTTGVNPTTGIGWKMRNCIGVQNYPCEIWSGVGIDADYNQYFAIDQNKFATLNGTTYISWATYHASYEANSTYADPVILDEDDNIYPTTPILTGQNLGVDYNKYLSKSTRWGDYDVVPSIVEDEQPATGPWYLGAY